jgi:hypothetical protein
MHVRGIDAPKISALADGRLDEQANALDHVGGLEGALDQCLLRACDPLPCDEPARGVE